MTTAEVFVQMVLTNFFTFSGGWWIAEAIRSFNHQSHFDWANSPVAGFAFLAFALVLMVIGVLILIARLMIEDSRGK